MPGCGGVRGWLRAAPFVRVGACGGSGALRWPWRPNKHWTAATQLPVHLGKPLARCAHAPRCSHAPRCCPTPLPLQVLDRPGSADLSAWVDFGGVRLGAQESGAPVTVHGPVSQAAFLQQLGLGARLQQLLKVGGAGRGSDEGFARAVAGWEARHTHR